MKFNTSTTSLIIILLIAGAGIYWYFFTGTEQLPLSAGGSKNQAQTEFQMLVGELTPISFDSSIFSDARFNALVDITTPIAPESVGRLDPFAVVTSVTAIISTTSVNRN